MAHKKCSKKYRNSKKATKPDIGLADALLELYADLRFSQAERRSFLEQAAVLWSRVKNQKRFLQYLTQFFDEAEQAGISGFKIGSYLKKRLQCKHLPKLDTSIDPFVGAESLRSVPSTNRPRNPR
jgi:hypothetical protein